MRSSLGTRVGSGSFLNPRAPSSQIHCWADPAPCQAAGKGLSTCLSPWRGDAQADQERDAQKTHGNNGCGGRRRRGGPAAWKRVTHLKGKGPICPRNIQIKFIWGSPGWSSIAKGAGRGAKRAHRARRCSPSSSSSNFSELLAPLSHFHKPRSSVLEPGTLQLSRQGLTRGLGRQEEPASRQAASPAPALPFPGPSGSCQASSSYGKGQQDLQRLSPAVPASFFPHKPPHNLCSEHTARSLLSSALSDVPQNSPRGKRNYGNWDRVHKARGIRGWISPTTSWRSWKPAISPGPCRSSLIS